jgi:hypothetical protein
MGCLSSKEKKRPEKNSHSIMLVEKKPVPETGELNDDAALAKKKSKPRLEEKKSTPIPNELNNGVAFAVMSNYNTPTHRHHHNATAAAQSLK